MHAPEKSEKKNNMKMIGDGDEHEGGKAEA
jgi:hypothetical protein